MRDPIGPDGEPYGVSCTLPQDIDRQIAESLEATPDLLPFLPELLADWTSSPFDELLRFLEPLDLPPTTRALDLGCDKGAVALALAERLGIHVVAVDAFPPFVEECRRRAEEKRLGHLCEFHCGDLRGWLEQRDPFDVALMIAVGAVLGDQEDTVGALRSCVRPGGYLVIDDGFLAPGCVVKVAGYEAYAEYEETIRRLTAHGDKLITEYLPAPQDMQRIYAVETDAIRRRALQLARKHPDAAPILNQYAARQRTETELAAHAVRSAVWLLQRAD